MESRLAQSALTQPEIPLARQQPVSKESPVHLQSSSLDEISAVRNQDRLDKVRTVEKVDTRCKCTVIENVAIFPCPLGKELQRITRSEGKIADQKMPGRARRELTSGFHGAL
jgi:hypothetical protein